MILREDMLELTRRMTLKRNCFSRIAGAYIRDGEVDETFNINFRRLSVEEQLDKLAIAREIPFAPTNQNLKDYRFLPKAQGSGSMWQFLMALNKCQLKNDALLDVIYEDYIRTARAKGLAEKRVIFIHALRNALKGYTRLNAKALQKIKPGGILFTFSCSQAVNKDQFRLAVFTAAAQSHRFVRILHQLHQPADHPVNIYHPEGEYLKGLVLYVE